MTWFISVSEVNVERLWMFAWLAISIVFSVAGWIILLMLRRQFVPTTAPEPAGKEQLDFQNPYSASATFSVTTSAAWRSLRRRAYWLRNFQGTLWVVAVGALLMPFIVPVDSVDFGPVFWRLPIVLGFLVIYSIGSAIWETPNRNEAVSFAKWAIVGRGIMGSELDDSKFIGASTGCRAKEIGNGSDWIGFLHLRSKTLYLHLHDRDVSIPCEEILELTRVKPKGDTLAWIGTRVIGVTWRDPSETYPQTLYLIAWGGETTFTIKRATDRLYQQLVAWRDSQNSSVNAEPAATHGTVP